jgi:ATP-binding cassette, subfamily B, bacterial
MAGSLISKYLIKPHWKIFVIAFMAVIIVGVADILEPWPIKIVIDHVLNTKRIPNWMSDIVISLFGNERIDILKFAVSAAIAIAVMSATASFIEKYLTIKVGQWVMFDLRQLLYSHLQRLSLSFYDKSKTGDLITRLTSDVEAIQNFVSTALLGIIIDIITLAGMLAIMLYINWRFTLIALSITPLLFLEVYSLTRRIKKATREVRKKESDVVSVVQETISSMRAVKAFGREDYEMERLKKETIESIELSLRARSMKARLSPIVDILIAVGTSIVLWYGARLVLAGQLTAGEMIIFLLYLRAMYKPMRDLSKMIDTASKAQIGAERISEIINTESQVREHAQALTAGRLKGDIIFEKVDFGYTENQPVLKKINFSIKSGEFAAFVGPTGGGKSTIINLIARFYDPLAGRILIDGKDVQSYTIDSLRHQISFVLQESFLFNASIRQNIAYGKPESTREEIYYAAKLANAIEFIEKMPEGFDTVVGERGVTLSGGQRQRIAIARAIVRDAPILILDEPTSGLDAASEELVLDALGHLMHGRTTLVIAHRMATIRRADLILVVNFGTIVESGTHKDLISKGGLYASLCEIQSREEEIKKLLIQANALISK